jgi:hypothetical protein
MRILGCKATHYSNQGGRLLLSDGSARVATKKRHSYHRTGGRRTPHSAFQPGQYFSGALKSLKNKPALPEPLFCVPTKTQKMPPMIEHASKRGDLPYAGMLRVYKRKGSTEQHSSPGYSRWSRNSCPACGTVPRRARESV